MRRISPGLVILVIALIGSLAFAAYAVTVRDTSQIPLFASGGVALGIVFMMVAKLPLGPSVLALLGGLVVGLLLSLPVLLRKSA